ncbi:MAG: DNA polymerase I, partial [Erythrobacter sp.]|nr:DNA polymerase I [Erythrobacter sp.]
MANKQHLYLVDGSAYIFRAYHRLPPFTNPQGVPVGAVYGYTTMLWKLADDLHKADGPTHLAVVLDKSSKSFRNEIYPQYKANRPPPPEDLRPQFPLIRDATRAFSLPCIEEPDVEADDMIASYARAAQRQGWDVTIVSSDKDLMQLVGEENGARIDMLDTMKNQRIYRPEVEEKFGVPPELVGDVLALMGDSVDNVPGIFGVGPKTASKLIAENGSLTAALDSAEAMKPSKLKERLIEHRADAEMSRVLVALKEDCPLPEPLDDFLLEGVPPEPLAQFLHTHGFLSLLRRLDSGVGSPERKTDLNPAKQETASAAAAAPGDSGGSHQQLPDWPDIDRSSYECVQTMERLRHWIDRAHAARLVAVDTETTSLDAISADIVGFSLALGPNLACYVPLGHFSGGGSSDDMFAEKPQQVDREQALAAIKPLLESDAVLKVGQNIKYDINVLARLGIAMAPVHDTMVISFDMDAGRSEDGIGGGHGMDELAERHLGHTTLKFKDLCGTGKKAISFAEVPLDRATEYAAEDADVTWRLYQHLHRRLPLEQATRVYEMVDRPLIPEVARMEREGIKVDRVALSRLSETFAEKTGELEREIHADAGEEFTIGSPK